MTLTIKECPAFSCGHFAVKFSSGFTTPVLNAVKSIPGRKWNGEEKIWLCGVIISSGAKMSSFSSLF